LKGRVLRKTIHHAFIRGFDGFRCALPILPILAQDVIHVDIAPGAQGIELEVAQAGQFLPRGQAVEQQRVGAQGGG